MPKLPAPRTEKKKDLMVEVKEDLLSAVKEKAYQRGVSMRSIVEYGLRKFLEDLEAQLASKDQIE